MKLWRVAAGICVSIHFLVISACEQRRFPTEQTAVEQLRTHQAPFRALAIDWLVSGNRQLYWFGREHGLESYTWNDCWAIPNGSQWQVRRRGRDNFTQPAKIFDKTAKICGASGEEVSSWIRRLESLGVDKLETISAVSNGTNFNFIQIGFFPETDTYGFAFAPPSDLTAQRALQSWARLSQPPRHRACGKNASTQVIFVYTLVVY